jgi:hypothetical protein
MCLHFCVLLGITLMTYQHNIGTVPKAQISYVFRYTRCPIELHIYIYIYICVDTGSHLFNYVCNNSTVLGLTFLKLHSERVLQSLESSE